MEDPVEKIRALLVERNWSHQELADRAELHLGTVNRFLGPKRCKLGRIGRIHIALALGLAVEDLWGELEEDSRGVKADWRRILHARLLRRKGFTYQQIGDILGTSRQAAHKLINRCR